MLAPVLFSSVLGSRSVRLGDALSGTDPQWSGSNPGSSSMGLIGSRSVRLRHSPSGSSPYLETGSDQSPSSMGSDDPRFAVLGITPSGYGAGLVWLGSSVSGSAPAQVRRVWTSAPSDSETFCPALIQMNRHRSRSVEYGPGRLALVRLGFVASGFGRGPVWLGS